MVDLNVVGKEVDAIVKGGKPGNQNASETEIALLEVKEPVGDLGQTWVVIHGNGASPDGENIAPLINEIVATADESDRVIALDWSEAAGLTGGAVGVGGGNGVSATWIGPTAEETVKLLESEFGIDPNSASGQLNIVGHSLGSFMSAEIGRLYELGENRLGQEVTTANGIGVRTITALDPANPANVPAGGYDVDGRVNGRQKPDKFLEVSQFARSFVGFESTAGSPQFADTADEAYEINFIGNQNDKHGRVIRAFTNLLDRPGKISDLLGYDSYESFSTSETSEFDEIELYRRLGTRTYQGIIDVNNTNEPIQLKALLDADNNDQIIIGDSQPDEIVGADGNDLLFGEDQNDILNGKGGDDNLNGGDDIDTAIFSDNFENYEYSIDPVTELIVFDHLRGTQADGRDTLENIEFAQFSDRRVALPLDGIEGAEIQRQSFNPNLQTPSSVPVTAVIGDGVEFGSPTPLADNNLALSYIDITGVTGGATIRYEITDPDVVSFLAADFNGYVLTDISDEIPPIENVTIDESENTLGLASSDVTFSENTIEVNVEGLAHGPGDGFLLNVEFADV